ncbi:MAG: cobalamin-binding protein [Bacteroidetes bacterium]|nr:MAG: cobalamin-binding protein [Bacteroidota bacterium]
MKIADHLNRTVTLKSTPVRVVSLVPSITETLADLGLFACLVGVTRFCKYPSDVVNTLPKIGGPKNFDIQKIVDLKPDLVVAVKEENDKEQILRLMEQVPVFVFDINTIEDSFDMLQRLGTIFDIRDVSTYWIKRIREKLENYNPPRLAEEALYMIWKNPWMAAGKSTFIGSMMQLAGFDNLITGRYPEIDENEMSRAETILLATDPYHFKESDRVELQVKLPDKKIMIVDGEMFTWYGTHMLLAIDYLGKAGQ